MFCGDDSIRANARKRLSDLRLKGGHYIYDDAVALMKQKSDSVIGVQADRIAAGLGDPRLVNTILIGVLSNYLSFDEGMWLDVIRKKVKEKFVDINVAAFNRGREIQLSSVKG